MVIICFFFFDNHMFIFIFIYYWYSSHFHLLFVIFKICYRFQFFDCSLDYHPLTVFPFVLFYIVEEMKNAMERSFGL